jgi:O-antigen/teichoic acid export membrane protein
MLTTEGHLLPSVRVARGATAVFMKSIAGAPLGLIYIAILTRLVHPGEMGVLSILGFFTSLLSVMGDLGLSGASSKFIPELLGRGEAFRALHVYRKILLLSIASAVTIFIILIPLSPYISIFLTRTSEYVFLTALAILSIPLTILFNVLLSLIQSFQHMKGYATLSFTQLNLGRFLGVGFVGFWLWLGGYILWIDNCNFSCHDAFNFDLKGGVEGL